MRHSSRRFAFAGSLWRLTKDRQRSSRWCRVGYRPFSRPNRQDCPGLNGDNVKKFDATEFDARCERCNSATRAMVAFLKTAAQHAGFDVEKPTFEVRGLGISYWIANRRFCRFDPKHRANHVWAFVPGGDRVALKMAGEVSFREDGPWVTIRNMHGAARLVPEILRAYDAGRLNCEAADAAQRER